MATQIGDIPLVQKLIDQQFEEIPLHQQRQQQQLQQQQTKEQQLRQQQQSKENKTKNREHRQQQLKQQRSSGSTTSPRRRISRQDMMSSLGLIPVIDQKNERGMSSLHIAAAAGNMCVIFYKNH